MAYSFIELLRRFPSPTKLSREIGVPHNTVRAWLRRDTLPPHYWEDVVAAANANGVAGVTMASLAAAAGAQREERIERARSRALHGWTGDGKKRRHRGTTSRPVTQRQTA
jgi:hypothetical protein